MIIISAIAVMVGSCALVLVLAIFEGLRNETNNLFNKFNPDIKISAKRGKYFLFSDEIKNTLYANKDIKHISKVIEDKALVKYDKNTSIAFIKGVDSNFLGVNRIDTMLLIGRFINKSKSNKVVVGSLIADKLLININRRFNPMQIFVPKKTDNMMINPQSALNKKNVYPIGIFRVQKDFDQKYIICNIDLAKDIFSLKDNLISYIAIKLKAPSKDVEQINKLKKQLGDKFDIKTKKEQNQLIYNILNTENIITYFIFSLILFIAMFNIISAISIIILNKKNDIKTMWKLGLPYNKIKSIFIYISMIIVSTGGIIGIAIGYIISIIQIEFEIVKAGPIPYPIAFSMENFLIVFITIVFLGYIFSKIAVENMFQKIKFKQIS